MCCASETSYRITHEFCNHRMGISLQAGGVPHGHSHGPAGGGGHSHGDASHEELGHGHTHQGKGKDNINVRAAFIHVLGDFLQSVGVFAAALVIYFYPDMGYIDPICTFLFSILVLITTFNIIKDVLNVFMEGKSCPFITLPSRVLPTLLSRYSQGY